MKNLIFLADENIPLFVIKELRKSGYNIISVAENYKGSSDKEILDLSSKKMWIIISFDKDFGDLIYKQKLSEPPHSRAVGHRPDKASEVTLTMACPSRSRAAGYSEQNKPFGIILLRIAPKSAEYILQLLKWLLSQPDIYFEGNFVVMNSDKVRTVKFS